MKIKYSPKTNPGNIIILFLGLIAFIVGDIVEGCYEHYFGCWNHGTIIFGLIILGTILNSFEVSSH